MASAIFNPSFSITARESAQLEKEYEINNILYYLNRASMLVGGGHKTINEAIDILKPQTRFAKEVEKQINSAWSYETEHKTVQDLNQET